MPNTGIYSAPQTEGTYHVRVVSEANPDLPAIAVVKVVPENVTVSINPASALIAANSTKSFTATVTGTSNTQVTWSVLETGGGTISQSGGYLAPSVAGTYTIKAVSVSDPTKSATATVTVTAVGTGGSGGNSNQFPFGVWVGPSSVSFTIDKAGQDLGLKYYGGSISYPGLTNGIIYTTGNATPDGMNGATIMGSGSSVSFGVLDKGNLTSMEAHLTQNASNPDKLEGILIVIPLTGATINTSNAVFLRQ